MAGGASVTPFGKHYPFCEHHTHHIEYTKCAYNLGPPLVIPDKLIFALCLCLIQRITQLFENLNTQKEEGEMDRTS